MKEKIDALSIPLVRRFLTLPLFYEVQVSIKLRDSEVVKGWIEYFDEMMIRLTREGKPNLFIYKQQIKSIAEERRSKARNGNREGNV